MHLRGFARTVHSVYHGLWRRKPDCRQFLMIRLKMMFFWRSPALQKQKMANYFDEATVEDIFDYIPLQNTNQIFPSKWVVKKMVDELEEKNLVALMILTKRLQTCI